jgi:single-stranded DNA-binding protein
MHHDRGSHRFAGNLTDQPEVRYTEGGITRVTFRMAVSGRREQEASFFTVVVRHEA